MNFAGKRVKAIRYGAYVTLVGSLLTGPPQTFAQDLESIPSAPLRLTVTPHASSRIAMKTLPKAICVLHADGDTAPSRSFKLFSDEEGMVRFSVNPSEESEEVTTFAVDCTADGQTRTFALQLRPHSTASADMPAPVADERRPQESDIVRRALTNQEALDLSNEEIIQRDYPPRPNPNQAPGAYATWFRLVTQPARRVEPRQAAHSALQASTEADSDNWSGFALKNAPNEVPVATYDLVEGAWYVPTVTHPLFEQMTYSFSGLDSTAMTACARSTAHKVATPAISGRPEPANKLRAFQGGLLLPLL